METTVAVGADKLWAEDTGGDGPVVVLLHPGVGDSRVWDRVLPGLAGSCRVIRYDARGYGRSPAPTQEYTSLGDLQRVLRHFGVSSAHLVGCSMGGDASLGLALAEPGRVQTLTLLCPGVSGYDWPDEPELEAEFEAAGDDEDRRIALYQRMWASAGAEPEVLDLLRSAVRAGPGEQEFCKDDEPIFDRLYDVQAPTVLMLGDRDFPPLIALDEEAARRIPGCRLIWMPGVDHLPSVREPELVTRTILDQVRSWPPAAG
jgi:3-oxoadipate enol-lactonase